MKRIAILTCFVFYFLTFLNAQPGSLDNNFGVGGKSIFNLAQSADFLNDLIVADDGSVLAVGVSERGPAFGDYSYIIRYGINGLPDPGFGDGGAMVIENNEEANAIALQPDGKILIAGKHALSGAYSLIRLLPDGTPDPDFGTNGVAQHPAIANSTANAIAIYPDGKIAVAGQGEFSGDVEFLLARFHSDGTIDDGFGENGLAHSNFGLFGTAAYDLALQPDGKVVVVGKTLASIAVARFDTLGQPDPSFDNDGQLTTNYGEAYSVAIQGDGKIIVGGIQNEIDTVFSCIVRYMPDGEIDPDFNPQPVATGLENWLEEFTHTGNDLVLQPDGKILQTHFVEVNGMSDFLLMRYLPNGMTDEDFGTNGFVVDHLSDVFERGRALALRPDGTIVLGGISDLDFALRQIDALGNVDPGFGGRFNLGQGEELLAHIALQPDGNILVGASNFATLNYRRELVVGRLLADGTLDGSFANGGLLTSGNGTALRTVESTVSLPNGKSLIAGNGLDGTVQLSRLLSDGSPDPGFGENGLVEFEYADPDVSSSSISTLHMQPDGKILVGGWWTVSGYDHFAVARFNEDGTFDETFGIDGSITTFFANGVVRVSALAVQGDGKIIAGGYQGLTGNGKKYALVRYLPNGSPDLNFGTDGKAIFSLGESCEIFQLAIQPDGKILAVGEVRFPESFAGVLRLTPQNGLPDASFGTDGWVLNTLGNVAGIAYDVLVQPNGSMLLAGRTGDVSTSFFSLTRLLPDGTNDPSFGIDGHAVTDFGTPVNIAYDMAQQPDGNVLLAGVAVNPDDAGIDVAIARYLVNLDVGTLDFSEMANELLVYPNPISTSATIKFETPKETVLDISLCDQQGRIVQSFSRDKKYPAGNQIEHLSIDNELSSGIYFLRLSDGKQSKSVQVFKK